MRVCCRRKEERESGGDGEVVACCQVFDTLPAFLELAGQSNACSDRRQAALDAAQSTWTAG